MCLRDDLSIATRGECMLIDQQIDEFLEMLAKSPTSARDMVRGLFAAHEAKAAPAVPQGVLEALRDAFCVCSSVSVSRDRKIVREGCTLYAQTEEWCNWAENEVAPKIRAAIELVATTATPSQEPVRLTDRQFDLICQAIDKADTITMEGDYMMDSDDCIGVVRVMQALFSIAALREKELESATLTDEYAGVIAWIGDKQCKRVLTENAIKHEHTPGVAMRNTAHQCVQEVILAALQEKEQAP